MFLFVTAIILTLSFGGLVFTMVRKIPVLLTLPEDVASPGNERKALMSRIKEIDLSRGKEIFSMENFKREKITEDKVSRKESFDKESDYWNKVSKK